VRGLAECSACTSAGKFPASSESPGQRLRHCCRLFRIESGDHHVLARSGELLRDPYDLLRGLAQPEDDLGHPLSQRAMVVDHGIAEVGEREIRQLTQRLIEAHAARADTFKKIL